MCKMNGFKDAMTYMCPKCTTVNTISSVPCSNCKDSIVICYQSLQLMSTPYYQCTYCDAKLSSSVNQNNRCSICNIGSLSVFQ